MLKICDKKVFLWFIMAIAVFIRLYPINGLTKGSITFNAGDGLFVSSAITMQSLWNAASDQISKDQAALRYIILHFFLFFGRDEFIIRFPAFLFGIASIYLTYLLGKSLFSHSVGLLSSFLLSLSPWHIHHSCYSEMYTLYVFFSLLSAYCFYNILINDSLWLKISFVLSSLLGFYSFHPFICVIFSELVFFVFFCRKKYREKHIFVLFLIIAVFLSPALENISKAFLWKKDFGDYSWGWGLWELFPELLSTFGGLTKFVPLNVFIFLFGFAIISKESVTKRKGIFLLLLIFIPLFFFLACFLLFKMNITGRYFLFIYPYFIVVAAFGIVHIKKRKIGAFLVFLFNVSLILLFLGKAGLATTKYIPYDYMRRDVDFNFLAKYLFDNYREGDVVVIEQQTGIFALQYYLDKNNLYPVKLVSPYCGKDKFYYRYDGDRIKNLFGLIEFDQTPQRLEKIWRSYNRLWLIDLDHLSYADSQGKIQAWINENYSRKTTVHGASIYLFGDNNKKKEMVRKGEDYKCDKLICFLDCKGGVWNILYPFQKK
ncbi:MAG TPA: hypothetical protein DCE80_06685 [Ignavibacteriales bacterium]|nr:hypothetical protein [Ignavibacteriales bacterium]